MWYNNQCSFASQAWLICFFCNPLYTALGPNRSSSLRERHKKIIEKLCKTFAHHCTCMYTTTCKSMKEIYLNQRTNSKLNLSLNLLFRLHGLLGIFPSGWKQYMRIFDYSFSFFSDHKKLISVSKLFSYISWCNKYYYRSDCLHSSGHHTYENSI